MTDHDCAIESIRHSGLSDEPSGVPSSKKGAGTSRRPRLGLERLARRRCSRARWRRARSPSTGRRCPWSAQVGLEKPSEPDALLASRPTRLKPSFQSPVPIRGKASTSQLDSALSRASAVVEHRSFSDDRSGVKKVSSLARPAPSHANRAPPPPISHDRRSRR